MFNIGESVCFIDTCQRMIVINSNELLTECIWVKNDEFFNAIFKTENLHTVVNTNIKIWPMFQEFCENNKDFIKKLQEDSKEVKSIISECAGKCNKEIYVDNKDKISEFIKNNKKVYKIFNEGVKNE